MIDPGEFVYYTTARRLRSRFTKQYATLLDVEALILADQPVRVTATPGGHDVTVRILCEILASRIKKGVAKPTVEQLTALLR